MRAKGRLERCGQEAVIYWRSHPWRWLELDTVLGVSETVKHEPQSKEGTRGLEKLGCAYTNFQPSLWGLHSCVSAHVCVCTCREVALIPQCFWLASWAVKWALSGWESPQAKMHMLAFEIRQCPLEKSEWRGRCRVMPDALKMKWVIIVWHLAKSPPRVSTPQRAWLTRKLDRCSLGWFNIFGWILFLFLTFSFGILNHD